MMRVRPVFLVAFVLAVVGGVLSLTLHGSKSRAERFQAAVAAEEKAAQAQFAAGRPYLAMTLASIDSLRVHSGLRPQTTEAGCPVGYARCYLAAQAPGRAAAELPGLLKSIGANTNAELPGYQAYERELRIQGLKDPAAGVSLNHCTRSSRHTWVVICTYYALLDHNEIAVLLDPYLRCGSDRRACRFSGEAQILIDVPGASSAGTSH